MCNSRNGFIISLESTLLRKVLAAIQAAILDGFGDMVDPDIIVTFMIGNGPGYFEDPVIGPGRQAQFIDGGL